MSIPGRTVHPRELPSIYGGGLPEQKLADHARLRVPVHRDDGTVQGHRNIDLLQLCRIALSDDGWAALCQVFRTYPEPAVGDVWDITTDGGRVRRFMRTINGWVEADPDDPHEPWEWPDVVALGVGTQVASGGQR